MIPATLDDLLHCAYVINLDERTDRWQQCQDEVRRLGGNPERLQRFSAVRSGVHGSIGCALSHANVLTRFLTESTAPWCLVLEDDFSFVRPAAEMVADVALFLQRQPAWDALLLSGNAVLSVVSGQAEYHRVIASQTASAYVVTRRAAVKLIPKLLLGAERLRELMPAVPPASWQLLTNHYAADQIWKDLQREGGWYILSRRTVVQRPSYSDIELRNVNYGV